MQKRQKIAAFFASLVMLLAITGCNEDSSKLAVDQIRIIHGAEQTATIDSEFPKDLRLELLSSVQKGMFGGSGSRKVLPKRKVTVEVLNKSDLVISKKTYESDVAGIVSIPMKSGKQFGDHYIKITACDKEPKTKVIRQIVGAEIDGANQEGLVGETLSNPLSITIYDENGNVAPNIPVYFHIGQNPEGIKTKAKLSKDSVFTDENGVAATSIQLGEQTGEYYVGVEVASPEHKLHIRNKYIKVFGFSSWNVIIAVAGGLAIFIFGMKIMSDGLQKVAGENMKKMLQLFAKNAWIAAIAGAIVTAVIQSSSATTVMVIGFINAGLLNLIQAIGIIFGANVGTTITAQIISFNLNGLAMPAIVLGLLVTLIFKRRSINGWGETVLGFGLLFFGMMLMSSELKVLGSFPSFISFFRTFNCSPVIPGTSMPILAVLGAIGIGTLMTVIIQSSSAAMGIILALAASGLIDFYTSIPLLLGTNIGTTITAFFASLAANRVAKQAALAHTMFNIFGTILMVGLFYVPFGSEGTPVFLYFINAITPGDAFAEVPQNLERHIAMAHTFFNVIVVLLLLPFINSFAKLCCYLLPVKNEESIKTEILEPHLLNTPSIALDQAVNAIRFMVKKSWKMVDKAINEFFINEKVDTVEFEKLAEKERKIDAMQQSITDYLVQITRHELSEPQSALVPLLMHCTNDAERIADHTENILNLTERLVKSKNRMSPEAKEEIIKMTTLLQSLADDVLNSLHSSEAISLESAFKTEAKINQMAKMLEDNHIARLQTGDCTMDIGIIFIEMVAEVEKIGDHLSNIAERTPEIQKHYIKI